MTTRRYPLGRHVNHDPRSRNFLAPMAATHKPVLHGHYGKILDQGQLGSCTGNALAGALNTKPLWAKPRRLMNEDDALRFYTKATAIDPFPGQYPPDDTGSDGLSVAKVAVSEGLITSYSHVIGGLQEALLALQLNPFIVGTEWTQDMFTPDSKGFVHPTGASAGGHEWLVYGDDGRGTLFAVNSWGPAWGLHGRFRVSYADFAQLQAAQGDITVLHA